MFRPGIPLPGSDADRGQPRPVEDARTPVAAERVRTLVESSVSAVLDIPSGRSPDAPPLAFDGPEARAVTEDGDVVLLVPASSPAARLAEYAKDDEITAVMELTDVAPVAVPDRVRGRAWIAGWLTTVGPRERADCARLIAERNPAGAPSADMAWTLLRLEVGEAYIDDLWGVESVEPDDFAAARPDPLSPHEAELLQHLAASHHEQMNRLCTLLSERGPACAAAEAGAVPLSLDRHGMRVRFCDIPIHGDGHGDDRGNGHHGEGCGSGCASTARGYFDVRFEFPEPVDSVVQLRRAMRTLFEAATE